MSQTELYFTIQNISSFVVLIITSVIGIGYLLVLLIEYIKDKFSKKD